MDYKELLLELARLEDRIVELESERDQLATAVQRAEQRSETRLEFFSHISREIRGPMNAVIGTTELLLDSPLLPDQQAPLELIKRAATALIHLVDDLRDFSNLDSGALDLDIAPMDLTKLMTRVTDVLSPQFASKNLVVVTSVDERLGASLNGDEVRIAQVLVNLLSNAIKFTFPGGAIIIRAEATAIGDDDVVVMFSVSDTGVGIPAHRLSKVLDLISHRGGPQVGSGFGLCVARRIVELMGGRMWVDSKLGVGSSFHFEVPLQYLPQAVDEEALRSRYEALVRRSSERPLNILVAEDNEVNRRLVSKVLTRHGHNVILATNGQEVLEMLKDQGALDAFDVVLMDCHMPQVDGWEVARRIREKESASDSRLPIIALTADSGRVDRKRCIESGMDGFVPNPFDWRELLNVIVRLTEANGR